MYTTYLEKSIRDDMLLHRLFRPPLTKFPCTTHGRRPMSLKTFFSRRLNGCKKAVNTDDARLRIIRLNTVASIREQLYAGHIIRPNAYAHGCNFYVCVFINGMPLRASTILIYGSQ